MCAVPPALFYRSMLTRASLLSLPGGRSYIYSRIRIHLDSMKEAKRIPIEYTKGPHRHFYFIFFLLFN